MEEEKKDFTINLVNKEAAQAIDSFLLVFGKAVQIELDQIKSIAENLANVVKQCNVAKPNKP
jgi:hypothetical protein